MNAGASTSCPTRSPAAAASASLGIVDDFSRGCLTTVVDSSLSGVRMVRKLERLSLERATPEVVVSEAEQN